MQLPRELSEAVQSFAAECSPRALERATREISLRYREGTSQRLQTGEHRAAYLAVRLPATYAAVSASLAHSAQALSGLTPTSLLDLGAGPGTASWAAVEIFPSLRRIVCLERDTAMAQIGERLAQSAPHVAVRQAEWISADAAAHLITRKFDLVVLSYILGELSATERKTILQTAWSATSQLLLAIEPGTPRGFENILEVRSELIRQKAHLAAPCPHGRECPLKQIAGEWCHFAQRIDRTSLHRRMKSAELGYEDEKFSYASFSRDEAQAAAARILRHPWHGKGHIRLELCARDGLQQLTVTRANKAAFRAARKARWGESWSE
jgi:ribosomal protein RSM22 (predicted rRNA methylase)